MGQSQVIDNTVGFILYHLRRHVYSGGPFIRDVKIANWFNNLFWKQYKIYNKDIDILQSNNQIRGIMISWNSESPSPPPKELLLKNLDP